MGGDRGTDGAEIWQGDSVGERRIRYKHSIKQSQNKGRKDN